jgi:phosphinothricin acetyltransferase
MQTRSATPADAEAIARIYNEGITDRVATFETGLRTAADILHWFDDKHPIVVVEENVVEKAAEGDGEVLAFAATSSYRPRECYAGVAEFSVYVARSARHRGAGRIALQALIHACTEAGFWKLVSRIFVENHASIALCRSIGFRVVGTYERHGQLDGVWRDVVIVERLLS